jgi:hypothetical protein
MYRWIASRRSASHHAALNLITPSLHIITLFLHLITLTHFVARVSAWPPAAEHPGKRRCIASRGACILSRSLELQDARQLLFMRHWIS